jgi:hypothetical protein
MVGFPLLLIPLTIYNIIVFLMPGVSLAEPIMKLTLISGAAWPLTLSDILVALGILMLLLEVMKGARPGAKYLTDHLLSLIVFAAALAEFLLWSPFASSTYFLLTLLTLVDFLSGVALRARRRIAVTSTVAAPEPRLDPVLEPAPSLPPAASVAESVLLERPEPKIAASAVMPTTPSLEVPSPGLQPGDGAPTSPLK